MTENKNFKLSDDTIAHIAKTLQVALITGTDIVDNLRIMELVDVDGRIISYTRLCGEFY